VSRKKAVLFVKRTKNFLSRSREAHRAGRSPAGEESFFFFFQKEALSALF
jgi:hypothetical protein